jgi:flagella basal body P-ring formation protein FlgA
MPKVFAITLTICLFIGLLQTADALEITFNPSGSVDDSVIKLGDIVNFDEETDMTRALATLTVGQSPAPGEQTSLRSLSIKDYLVSSQSLPQDIRWTGSPTITVHRQGMNIGSEKILAIIAEFIKKNQNNLPEAEIRFVPASLPLPFILPTGDLTYEVIPSNPDIISSSRFSIIFRIDNSVVKNMSVRGNMEALTQVVVSVGSMT